MSDQLTPAERELLQRAADADDPIKVSDGLRGLGDATGLVGMGALRNIWVPHPRREGIGETVFRITPAGRAVLEVAELRQSRDAWREVAKDLGRAACSEGMRGECTSCSLSSGRDGFPCRTRYSLDHIRALTEKEKDHE